MKRKVCMLLAAWMLACFAANAETVWHVTDVHHLSPLNTDHGPMFARLMAAGDGKLTEYSGEMLDALVEEALRERPDALVVTGDLTFYGQKQSLLEAAEKLSALAEAGIDVMVLPGNHDISSRYSYGYFGDGTIPAENVSQAEFAAICASLGPDRALSRDEASLSYVCALKNDVWLVLLDANTDAAPIGALPESTLVWLEAQLERAKEAGATVLSFSHQNLLPVNRLFARGFVIRNCAEVTALYEKYGVKYNFSGHAHLQHATTSSSGLTEIVTGALCVSPLGYGRITVDETGVSYETALLPAFQEQAAARFREVVLISMRALLNDLGVNGDAAEQMADYAARLNQAYFAGDREAVMALKDDPAWEMWRQTALSTAWFMYMWSIFETM